MPERSALFRTRAVVAGSAAALLAVAAVIAVVISGDDPSPSVGVAEARSAVSTTVSATAAPTAAGPTAAEPTAVEPTAAATTTTPVPETEPPTTQGPQTTVVAPLPVEVVPPQAGNVLFSTSFDAPGTALDNGMLLPGMGPHITPRPGVVANGAIFRDPAMTEWEDVLVRAPVGPLTGDRYIEAVVTVASNGPDAHPAIMFFDDPGTTSGGCAGGSTMDWAEVDPWNNMQVGRISFVVNGCYDATTHVFAGLLGEYQTYTVRAEIIGNDIVMKVNGAETARTAIPTGLALPFAGLRLGQFGTDGGFDQYRIESFEVGRL